MKLIENNICKLIFNNIKNNLEYLFLAVEFFSGLII